MTYRAPLLHPETKAIDSDLGRILTTAQYWKLAMWSLETNKPVGELLKEFNPMAEEVTHKTVRLIGKLPTCGLYGSVEPDGQVCT